MEDGGKDQPLRRAAEEGARSARDGLIHHLQDATELRARGPGSLGDGSHASHGSALRPLVALSSWTGKGCPDPRAEPARRAAAPRGRGPRRGFRFTFTRLRSRAARGPCCSEIVSTPGELERLARAADVAKLVVPIAAAYPLAGAAKAHERLAQGHVLGKIALHVHRA
ncbi:zinc-binding dehydrogenase [Sorangium sp. So ce406]|uniref:zinc-binding dehydrogenase n=1 Tax=Sorangium sp. So ce406 TaxID=3133311 RepID=UPI003F5C5CE3